MIITILLLCACHFACSDGESTPEDTTTVPETTTPAGQSYNIEQSFIATAMDQRTVSIWPG